MSIQQQLFTSFIKGVAKTTGSLTVLTLAATIWHFYTLPVRQSTKESNQNKVTHKDQVNNADNINNIENIDDFFIDNDNDNKKSILPTSIGDGCIKNNFKKIFD